MTWLLDTSVCVPLINRSYADLTARLLGHTPGSIYLWQRVLDTPPWQALRPC